MTRMPMVLTDPRQPDNPIVFANHAFLELTGYAEAEVIGRNCRFLQGPRTSREGVAELRQAIEQHLAVSVELLNYKRDGTPFWNAVYLAPVHDGEGRLVYFFASQLDVTRRRTSEQAFRQAQKMESIGQLTAGLAHDFNNLLLVASGNLEILRSSLGESDLQRYAARIGKALERGTKVTRQLLAFARKTRLDPRPTDLSTLINEFGEMLETTAGSRVDLQFNLRRRRPPAEIDPVHLEMALLNVIINARDAMPGGGTITIATAAGAPRHGCPEGRYVVLSVTDEGTGMPPHVLERATEPFFTTKGVGEGTGLGLAMVQGFVQQSRGLLEIDSEEGAGTTIRMLFPAAREAVAAAPRPRPAGPLANPAATGETILVVEDNEDILNLALEHLGILGYRALAARSADEALDLLDRPENGPVDLLFTDILMPGSVNGFVLAEQVRKRLPEVAVLYTTGYNEDLLAEAPRSASMDVLGKPYLRAELADRVRAALDRTARPALARRTRPGAPGPRHEG
ncbi:PAS domain-containing protein [Roseomonas nepalensis]|uniref:histidine kinase n=2 Tax=Muricoccus nepalensis TaxID=1854500 RepID=A0A502G7G3_9PROT|nr:PAS domain-containing protein [Roseomonas nepalensis]